MYKFREKMAESIVKQGDTLWTIERFNDGDAVVMWYIVDGKSHNDPFGRKPQYQVWFEDKRCYVGSDRNLAYADFNKQKEEWIYAYACV